MPDYSKNYLNMLTSRLDVVDDTGNPKQRVMPELTDSRDTLDVREILTNIVGRNYKSMSDENIRSDYAKLSGILGVAQARKMVDHAIIFNQNPSNQKNSVENRVQSFFQTPSSDNDVSSVVKKVSGFGDGVVAGYFRSPDVVNQKLAGTYDETIAINKDYK